jgi:SAM-dependent MidA family methyltransferase
MTTFDDIQVPTPAAQQRSDALSALIQHDIQQNNGFIPFSHFMNLALYHPTWGYYQAEEMALGRQGDFTTAPEISPLFAYALAQQCAAILPQLLVRDLLEVGAGSGRLAGDLLLALNQCNQLPEHYYIVELSTSLRQQQQAWLQMTHPELFSRIIWLDTLPISFKGIIIANEVLDALPVDCFQIADTIQERGVTWTGTQFDWHLRPADSVFAEPIAELQTTYHLPNGYRSEINFQLALFIQLLGQSLQHGVILFADYGYGQREYYHPERNEGTLTCFYQHRRHANPLILPGLQDMTAHVDFTRVAELALEQECDLLGYTTQAAFLLANGLIKEASRQEAYLSPAEQVNLHHAIKL